MGSLTGAVASTKWSASVVIQRANSAICWEDRLVSQTTYGVAGKTSLGAVHQQESPSIDSGPLNDYTPKILILVRIVI